MSQGENNLINLTNLRKLCFKNLSLIRGMLYSKKGEIYYIGGNDVLPPPLESDEGRGGEREREEGS